MKIFVTGTRGIPNIPGGIETHCQNLYPLIADKGHEVFIATRSSYATTDVSEWKGVHLVQHYSPRKKSFEAIVHTFLAIAKARLINPDVVHIHGVGPALLTPLARLLGLKVVFTSHGPDYDRQKWSPIAKRMLRLGEYLGGKFAHEVIVISRVIAEGIRKNCGRESNLIYNGMTLATKATSTAFLEKNCIRPGNYILAVARFVPEKGLHDLIEAFFRIAGDTQLVIAGDADHETEYSQKLKLQARKDDRVILTGYISGDSLNEVFSHARLFVLPSYHEGLPIALLEALSYGLPALVSNIPANVEIGLHDEQYFNVGNVQDLSDQIKGILLHEMEESEKEQLPQLLAEKYNWETIARQTIEVYRKAIGVSLPIRHTTEKRVHEL
nr:glycosyltransferase family 4 protein [Desulfobulbaceae bacterium]